MNPTDRGVPQFSGITKYDLQLAGAGGQQAGTGAGSLRQQHGLLSS